MSGESAYPENGECDMSDHGACGHFGWCAVCPEKPRKPGIYNIGVLPAFVDTSGDIHYGPNPQRETELRKELRLDGAEVDQ